MGRETEWISLAAADGWTDWLPTADNINALPEPIRLYIAEIESCCDPAGELRDLVLTRDENAMLRGKVREWADEIQGFVNGDISYTEAEEIVMEMRQAAGGEG